ncbi:MAG: glycosyltransferase family 4 protein [Deltaproteobacteria bacterium]|nr:glycosyltransferase family 4 protein [Deltaproteobacteria bacterium]
MAKTARPVPARICHVITTPQDQFASGLRTRLQAQICQDLGFEVDVVTGWGLNDPGLVSPPLAGVVYHRLPYLTKYVSPRQDFQALIGLYRLFRKRRYQVVQTHLAKAGVLGRIAAGLARVPVVVHDVPGYGYPPTHARPLRRLYLALDRWAGHFTTHYIFYAKHLLETFEAMRIGPRASKTVIHTGVDFSSFLTAPKLSPRERDQKRAVWGLSPQELVIGYVARMVPSKGHDLAIRALRLLLDRRPQAKLFLIGGAIWPEEKKFFGELQALVQESGVSGKVIFAGHQSQVVQYYQMFDVYVSPSLFEGSPLNVTEAVLMELPVVAFNIPAISEFFSATAIITPLGDIAGLSRGLEQAITQVMAGHKQSSPAFRKKLVETFSPARWRKNLTDFYQDLILGNHFPEFVGSWELSHEKEILRLI